MPSVLESDSVSWVGHAVMFWRVLFDVRRCMMSPVKLWTTTNSMNTENAQGTPMWIYMTFSCNHMCALGTDTNKNETEKINKWKTDFHMVNAIWFNVETLNRYNARNFYFNTVDGHACVFFFFFGFSISVPDSSSRHPKKCYICFEMVIRYGSWMNKLPEKTSKEKKMLKIWPTKTTFTFFPQSHISFRELNGSHKQPNRCQMRVVVGTMNIFWPFGKWFQSDKESIRFHGKKKPASLFV